MHKTQQIVTPKCLMFSLSIRYVNFSLGFSDHCGWPMSRREGAKLWPHLDSKLECQICQIYVYSRCQEVTDFQNVFTLPFLFVVWPKNYFLSKIYPNLKNILTTDEKPKHPPIDKLLLEFFISDKGKIVILSLNSKTLEIYIIFSS